MDAVASFFPLLPIVDLGWLVYLGLLRMPLCAVVVVVAAC